LNLPVRETPTLGQQRAADKNPVSPLALGSIQSQVSGPHQCVGTIAVTWENRDACGDRDGPEGLPAMMKMQALDFCPDVCRSVN
jgi:hypothetical protein